MGLSRIPKNGNKSPAATFDRGGEILSADREFDNVLLILDMDSITSDLGAVDFVFDVRLANEPVRNGNDSVIMTRFFENRKQISKSDSSLICTSLPVPLSWHKHHRCSVRRMVTDVKQVVGMTCSGLEC